MARRTILSAVVVAAMSIISVGPAGATTTTALAVPQGTAFGVLGHSCGGIQEQAFATGFDATTGYPTGDVYLQTRCGGSGRGGGYHTTTYSAWVGVEWDFTGAVISAVKLSAAPATDPTFSAFDTFGNEVYNASNLAYLTLADTFVPAPRVTGISVATGPASGGTSVTITGDGFTGATAVSFGSAAAAFTVNSDSSISATSPAADGVVDVTVTSAGGTSAPTPSDQFTFVAAPSVDGVSPDTGPVGGGTVVTISGSALSAVTSVSFGDTPAGFTVNDDTSITATAPAAEAADSVDITVASLGGTSAVNPGDRFDYVAVPGAPTGVSATAGDGDATVRWSAPASNGAPITGYVVTPFLGATAQSDVASTGSATMVTVPGLTNGAAYTFRVAAVSGTASGPSSLPSPAVVVGAPSPPSTVRARSGATSTTTGALAVSFVPGANNGAAITGYTARCTSGNGGIVGVRSGAASPLTVASLTTGKSYTCTVRATNARGTGAASGASTATIVGAPAAPTAVVATRVGAGQLKVTFTLGADNGSAITGETAVCTSTSGATHSATHVGATAAPITVVGLTPGASYTCTVRATNARGPGARSAPSAPVVA